MLTKQEIRQLANREMMDELQKSRRELLKYQFDTRSGTSKEVHVLKNLRRYIAQLQTIAKEMNVDMNMKSTKTKSTTDKASAPAEETKAAAPAPAKKSPAPKKAAKAKPAKAPAKKTPAAKSAKK